MKSIAFVLALMLAAAVHADPKFFPLGLWYEGGVGDARDNVIPADPVKAAAVYEKNFADIAAHGINLIVVPNSPPEHHKVVLEAAQKHKLKVILELGLDGGPFGHMIRGQKKMDDAEIQYTLDHTLAPIKDHPALLRVQLLDEPTGDAFGRYGHIAEAVRNYSPGLLPFCCLTGNSDGGKFLEASKGDVVAYDAYPFGPATTVGDAEPLRGFANLAGQFTQWADEHKADAWGVVQCHAITGGLRFPTPAEMRAMTWSSLAMGNKGVFWFLYQSESVGKDVMMDGLVDRQFKSRPLWDEVAKLAEQLAPLTPVLARLRDSKEMKTADPMLLARSLVDGQGHGYTIVVNLDVTKAHSFKLGEGDALEIPPGDGKLLRVPKP